MKVRFKSEVYNEIKNQLGAGYAWGRVKDDGLINGFQSYSIEFLDVPYFKVKDHNYTSYLVVDPPSIEGLRVSKCHVVNLPTIDFDLQDDLFEWSE